jgi:hypothetical protein
VVIVVALCSAMKATNSEGRRARCWYLSLVFVFKPLTHAQIPIERGSQTRSFDAFRYAFAGTM